MGYLSRKPTSNDPPRPREEDSPWLGDDELMDKVALVLNGLAKRCKGCRRMTHIRHLNSNGYCPDCRGN